MVENVSGQQVRLIDKALGRDPNAPIDIKRKARPGEQAIFYVLMAFGLLSVFTTLGIVFVLGEESLRLFASGEISIVDFFTGIVWKPTIDEFGVIPLVTATLMTSFIAMLVAIPLGIGAAVYLSEYASPRVRNTLKPILEILAGIPTVVYGYFAITFMTPLLQSIFGANVVGNFNTASAGIVVGILIIPLISSLSEDALAAVPHGLRQASYGLGATKLETTWKVVIPAALSGLVAAFIIAVSRAIGETMVVAMAAGAGANLTGNPFEPAQTMTGYIASISGGDVSYDTPDYNSIFAIGLTLFVVTLILNILSNIVVDRFKETYQ